MYNSQREEVKKKIMDALETAVDSILDQVLAHQFNEAARNNNMNVVVTPKKFDAIMEFDAEISETDILVGSHPLIRFSNEEFNEDEFDYRGLSE